LLTRVNRYVLRPHAQISNLYKLDQLILLIAKYLAEHIARIWPDFLLPMLRLTWQQIWEGIDTGQLRADCPGSSGPTAPW
jgi:hypothetical protein